MSNFGAPHYQPYQFAPPKKRHTVRNVLLAVIVTGAVLMVAGLFAAVEQTPATDAGKSAAAPTSKPAAQPGSKRDTRLDRNKPTQVKVGQAVTKGRHRLEAGWSLRSSQYLETFEVAGAEVTNISDRASAAFIEIKVYRGTRLLGNVSCSSPDIEPGETATVDCFTSDRFARGWTRVTVGATF